MNKTLWTGAVCLPLFFAACNTQSQWHTDEVLAAQMVELQVDSTGQPLEIEYHVDPAVVPAAVHASMDELHPGGTATGAEKEYVGSTLYWELTKTIAGHDVEAMFLPDGTLHSEEIEVAASAVPAGVQDAVTARMPGLITKWEEIRDGDRTLVEFHAKLTANGMKYKVSVSVDGEILGIVREVPAEIEVPVN